jgi:hypothetical protein
MSHSQSCPRWALALSVLLLACPAQAAEAPREVHGENSVFASYGIAMAWAVLRGASEDETQVVIRILPLAKAYAYLRIEGLDPFTQQRREMLRGQALGKGLDVHSPRATFAEFTRREIQFYTADDWAARRPSLTVYYLGVPDTAPEFTSEAALSKYLDDALAKVRSQARGEKP